MIITVLKPADEIEKNLAPYCRIFIVGCAACASKCQTGNEDALKVMAERLSGLGKTVSGYKVLDTPCDIRIAKKDLKQIPGSADVLLIMACGAGVQAIERAVSMPVSAALNPVFIGTVERIGHYHEYCSICGDCILDKTGGICPVTRCAKGLINGPCGGAYNGKCEVDRESDCAWVLIYNKINAPAGIAALKSFLPPRVFSKIKRLSK